MRISDWSSDVFSSDLLRRQGGALAERRYRGLAVVVVEAGEVQQANFARGRRLQARIVGSHPAPPGRRPAGASCRRRPPSRAAPSARATAAPREGRPTSWVSTRIPEHLGRAGQPPSPPPPSHIPTPPTPTPATPPPPP